MIDGVILGVGPQAVWVRSAAPLRVVASAVRFLLATSPACLVPEIAFLRPGESTV